MSYRICGTVFEKESYERAAGIDQEPDDHQIYYEKDERSAPHGE